MRYSDYIIFADESGDPNPASMDANYPVFVLNFCVFRKDEYVASVLPALAAFKFAHFGHDTVVLHENEIRLQKPPFAFLRDDQKRRIFMTELDHIIEDADFTIISIIVDKRCLVHRNVLRSPVYELALDTCAEHLRRFLASREEGTRIAHVVIESRGKVGDGELKNTFEHGRHGEISAGNAPTRFELRFADKKSNSPGLQIADLTARPIGRHFINPEQSNRAWDVIQTKLLRSSQGNVNGWGRTVLPR